MVAGQLPGPRSQHRLARAPVRSPASAVNPQSRLNWGMRHYSDRAVVPERLAPLGARTVDPGRRTGSRSRLLGRFTGAVALTSAGATRLPAIPQAAPLTS